LPLVKKKFYIACTEQECLKLYELLKDRMPTIAQVIIEVTEKGLLVEAYGYETDIKDLWFSIKSLIGPLKEATRKAGIKKIKVELVTKTIHKTFPPRVLVETLRRKGFYIEYNAEDGSIVTSASFNEVVALADKIADLSVQASRLPATTSTRYFVIAACAITGLSIEEVINMAMEIGLIEQGEGGRYIVKRDWRESLDSFLKHVRL
jgi:hypothetical protein